MILTTCIARHMQVIARTPAGSKCSLHSAQTLSMRKSRHTRRMISTSPIRRRGMSPSVGWSAARSERSPSAEPTSLSGIPAPFNGCAPTRCTCSCRIVSPTSTVRQCEATTEHSPKPCLDGYTRVNRPGWTEFDTTPVTVIGSPCGRCSNAQQMERSRRTCRTFRQSRSRRPTKNCAAHSGGTGS